MTKVSVLIIGGLGVEFKVFISGKKYETGTSVGGSGWHLALALKALGCSTSIMTTIGKDIYGKYLKYLLDKYGIRFVGAFSNPTQEYKSTINNGVPIAFSAIKDNININEIKRCLTTGNLRQKIVIVGYVNFDVLEYITRFPRHNKKIKFVLNLSDAIKFIPHQKIIKTLQLFDIVTMNSAEAMHIASILGLKIKEFLVKINSSNTVVFITSKTNVIYITDGKIENYKFERLEKVIDTTGAGDVFTANVAIGMYKNMEIKKVLLYAVENAQRNCLTKQKDKVV